MRHLFVARHGDYSRVEEQFRLDDSGREQMEILGKSIREILGGGSVRIFSSTAPRALDSSEILVAQLGLSEFERVPYLWSGNDSPKEVYSMGPHSIGKSIINLIEGERKNSDGLIVVTHLEIVGGKFPIHYLREIGKEGYIDGVQKGEAGHFDFEEKIYRILPRQERRFCF